ncbi:MAG: hypothetical protein ACPGVO_19075 [Spirulinaceae cyanobacterium]
MSVKRFLLSPDQNNLPLIDLLLRIALLPFLLRTFYRTVESGLGWMRGYDGYIIGDWLINYQGGFVRRGFLGEGLLHLRALSGIPLNSLAMGLQLLLYGLIFGGAAIILLKTETIAPYLLLIFSPFLFRFQLQGFRVGFRKEILAFALLACITYAVIYFGDRLFELVFILALSIYPLLILSHETLILLMPYFIVLYTIRQPLNRATILRLGSISFLSVLALLAALVYKGGPIQPLIICQSLLPEIMPDCTTHNTAIGLLNASATETRQQVLTFVNDPMFLVRYGLSIFLAAIAFLPFLKTFKSLVSHKALIVLLLLSLSGTVILGAVAVDWDRFLYLHLMALFFLSLAKRNQQVKPQTVTALVWKRWNQLRQHPPRPGQYAIVVLLAIATFIYAKGWYITSCCVLQYGYLPLSRFGIDLVQLFLPSS